ncbi:MAG: glycosyltransferase family 4 protein [Actinomycetota bacterium]|nr:glycosyltransferase family 4 protein [Actinomycetota bacterium]
MRELLPRLADAFDVLLFAVTKRDGDVADPVVPTVANRLMGDPFGREQLPALLSEHEPDVVLLHHDVEFFPVHQEALRGRRTVLYCPIEWERTRPERLTALRWANLLVTYTRFGRRVIADAFGEEAMPPVETIGHGVSPGRFPAMPRGDARRLLFPDRPELGDAFVVLNANRNSPRKRIDLTLEAFARFARDRRDAYLYLHMAPGGGTDVTGHAEFLGVAGRILTTPADDFWGPDVPDATLAAIYGACDVGINTSTGEGWGLVAFEHALAGAPQVLPDHTAPAELWKGKALLVPAAEGEHGDRVVSVEAASATLQRLYEDEPLRARFGEAARKHALDPSFDWNTIAQSWKTLLLKEADSARSVRARDV